jgi:hypothetical protein
MCFSSLACRAGGADNHSSDYYERPTSPQRDTDVSSNAVAALPSGEQATPPAPDLYRASDLWRPGKDRVAFALLLSTLLEIRSFFALHLTEFTR